MKSGIGIIQLVSISISIPRQSYVDHPCLHLYTYLTIQGDGLFLEVGGREIKVLTFIPIMLRG